MIADALASEMRAMAGTVTFRHVEILRGMGVPVPSLLARDLIGVTKVETDSRDFWQPCPTGKTMVVTPLFEVGQTVDLIVFDLKAPDIWYLRTGRGWALGAAHIEDIFRNIGWAETQQWVDLCATPLDWLRGGAAGACVTQWTDEARRTLRMHQQVQVTSPKFARALRLELTRPPRIPEIEVRGMQSRAA
ncbi:hypothetical protein [Sphingobium sp. YR768]|uniref:hypothetical protein n=1 Tax=Sphingobium sp. YR768 TaxID=1884365 RepID=UPI0008B30F9F|nr:hypothetical protein [Sphingobium sp. YR768]SES08266.1 hypothetical protein SAMN05518866_13724 [Sphingobium sp. YR768]